MSAEACVSADVLEHLVAAAVRAPSGDNTQPWRFEIDAQSGRAAVLLDEMRDPSPMNAGQRMARLALGAALENLLRAARALHLAAVLEAPAHPAVACVRVTGSPVGVVDEALFRRVTNRRLYDGRPLFAGVLSRLHAETPVLDGVTTHWIVERGRIHDMAILIARADEVMLGEGAFLRAFLRNVRFDAAAEAPVEEGLSLASLELTRANRLALRLLPRLPSWLLKHGGLRPVAMQSKKLVESASALCLIVAPDSRAETDLVVGRALQRAWLALGAEDMAGQPMMSLLVLESVADHGCAAIVGRLRPARLARLRERLRVLAPEIGAGRPAFLLRVGFGPPPSGRVGRRPLESVLVQKSPAL